MSAAILLHTNLPVINRLVALMPAWARLCTAENTVGCVGVGTSGLQDRESTTHVMGPEIREIYIQLYLDARSVNTCCLLLLIIQILSL